MNPHEAYSILLGFVFAYSVIPLSVWILTGIYEGLSKVLE